MFSICNKVTRRSLIRFFFFSFLSSSYYLFMSNNLLLFKFYLSSSYYLFKSNSYIITIIIIDLLSLLWWWLLQLLFWSIFPVQLFLRNQVGKSSKKGIQAEWSTSIHHVKWWISRFRGIYRACVVTEAGLFLILLKGLRPLCNVTRSSVLVAVGVLYLPLHFIIIVIIIVVVIIVLLILLLLLILFLLFQLLFSSGAVYCSYEVSWPFGLFLSISSSILTWSTRPPFGVDALPRYHHLASFNYDDMKAKDMGRIVDFIWAILCLTVSPMIIERWGKV